MIQLYNGDCLEVMKQIPDGSIDMVLCDLPYGTTACDWDKPIDFETMWTQYRRICKPNSAIVLFSAQPFTTDLINSNRKDFRYEIIWEKTLKTGFYSANKMPLKGHENILVFYRKLPTYHPQKYKVERSDVGRIRTKKADRCVLYGHVKEQDWVETGERYPHDVIHFSNWNGALFGNTQKATRHPTQKPIPVLEYLIKTYSNEGNTILDNTMGSGSTGVACVNTNRNFIGIELQKDFFDIAKQRIEDAQNEPKQISLFDECKREETES